MEQALVIEQLILSLVQNVLPLVGQAYQAVATNDQAALDALHKQVVSASEALKPAGATDDIPVA